MEEERLNIKKIIITVDDEQSYSIDVDETTTFYEFKKIFLLLLIYSRIAFVFIINNKNIPMITMITQCIKCSRI